MKIIYAAFAALMLHGCMTITASKSLVVSPEPGETKIVVTGNATTHCQDYFFFSRCTLTIEMQRAR